MNQTTTKEPSNITSDAIAFTCMVFAMLFVGSFLISINNSTSQFRPIQIEIKETKDLKCAGVNAIGCTTVLSPSHLLIEYVPDSQRCHKEGCISIQDTIDHEMRHVMQYKDTGRMWEWE